MSGVIDPSKLEDDDGVGVGVGVDESSELEDDKRFGEENEWLEDEAAVVGGVGGMEGVLGGR